MHLALLVFAFADALSLCEAEVDNLLHLAHDSDCESGAVTCRAGYEDDAVVLLQTKHSLLKEPRVGPKQPEAQEQEKRGEENKEDEQADKLGFINQGRGKPDEQEDEADRENSEDYQHENEEDEEEEENNEADQDNSEDYQHENEEEDEEEENNGHDDEDNESDNDNDEHLKMMEEEARAEPEQDKETQQEETAHDTETKAYNEMADNVSSVGLLMESAQVNFTALKAGYVDKATQLWAATIIGHLAKGDCKKRTTRACFFNGGCPDGYECYGVVCTQKCSSSQPYTYRCGAYCAVRSTDCRARATGIIHSLAEMLFGWAGILQATVFRKSVDAAMAAHRISRVAAIKLTVKTEANALCRGIAKHMGVTALENSVKLAAMLPGVSKSKQRLIWNEGAQLVALAKHGNDLPGVIADTILQIADPTGLAGVYSAFAADNCPWFKPPAIASQFHNPNPTNYRRSYKTRAPRTRRRRYGGGTYTAERHEKNFCSSNRGACVNGRRPAPPPRTQGRRRRFR